MSTGLEQAGVLAVVMQRFEKQRLPRILDIKALVDRGETLSNLDIEFLEEVFEDTQDYQPFVDKHPEFQQLYARVAHLYNEIASEALDNEKQIHIPGQPASS
ncbi:MAG: hypothetical protein H6964_15225 [Chromatiaceae bacterium]|nr:hypothetical protein [Gammaproteobacteria bacterium]MCB1872671.1 hypothetical protein [Gammaproteobacteria bacterium]MCB1880086.1 hypothetical protein [Gammaproteobacteria bacterium]MCB1904458.1 hypothetical protein [Gammaproteobacteria bacterium]MCP5448326.1 hypothetical protein [Chromatiaceae bacterium]